MLYFTDQELLEALARQGIVIPPSAASATIDAYQTLVESIKTARMAEGRFSALSDHHEIIDKQQFFHRS